MDERVEKPKGPLGIRCERCGGATSAERVILIQAGIIRYRYCLDCRAGIKTIERKAKTE